MIRGTYGRGGSGKSLRTVGELHRLFKQGRDVFANTPLVDLRVRVADCPNGTRQWVPVDPVMFGESWAAGYVDSFHQLYDLDNCAVLLDELGAWAPSHLWREIPEEVRRFLAQDRREGVDIWWTHRTTRVFNDILDNTAELTRCERFGPLVRCSSYDPQEKDKKPLTRWISVNPMIYDLYDTMARVGAPEEMAKGGGSAADRGYGIGRRRSYGGLKSGRYYVREFRTLGDQPLRVERKLTEGQAVCLIRKFGPEAVALVRQSGRELPGYVQFGPGEDRHELITPSARAGLPDWSGLRGKGRESYC